MSDLDIVKEFLIESNENLDRLDRNLVELEKHPADREILADIFRTIHTIKGTSGFLAFPKLEAVAHGGENLLARLRDGELRLNPEITTALLALVDAVRQMLETIGANGSDGNNDYPELIARLKILQEGSAAPAPTMERPAPAPAPAPAPPPPADTCQKFQPTPDRLGALLVAQKRITAEELARALQDQEKGNKRPLGEILVGHGALTTEELQESLKILNESRSTPTEDATIRVRVAQLDRLMNLVGELVLARNRIQQWVGSKSDSGLVSTSQRLNLITTELQEGVMKTRLQPIGNIWSKFPRTVRDVALGCGKQVRIEMEGRETELDKTIIEAIKDPLTHLVRNAVDHGIEPPEVRQAAGKPSEGCLRLRAFHEGGQVNIEITDDGAGLNLEKIRDNALQRELISAEQASRLSERELCNLIFLPGLSTAEKVTNVSGRGVGMDVVRTNIEKIGGMVDIQSKSGQGTTVRMKIPLTLAIIPALIVTSAGERYAIPQVSLLELVGLDRDQARTGIETIHKAPVYRLRGRLLPLVCLNRELEVGARAANAATSSAVSADQSCLLDFAKARYMHEQWLDRLRQVLDGSATMTVEQAGSPTQCGLGKWLYESGLKDYSNIPEIHQVEAAHKCFHELVRGVVALKAKRDGAGAEHAYTELGQASGKVLDLLRAVEAKVLSCQNVNIVVLQADGREFGLVVDEVNDTEEIVVKPLGKHLKDISVYAGATIMGDGKVALILDVLGIAQRAHILAEGREPSRAETEPAAAASAENKQKLVLFAGRAGARMAVPLDLLARLENIPGSQVERSGNQWVTQYRGQILPLIRVTHALEERRQMPSEQDDALPLPTSAMLQVLVLENQQRSFGLVVNQILDIVESALETQSPPTRPGVLYSAVIAERVTEILDVPAILNAGEIRPPAAAHRAGS